MIVQSKACDSSLRSGSVHLLRPLLIANALILSVILLAAGKSAVAQSDTQPGKVSCVKREAELRPPNVAMPGRRAANGRQQEFRARLLKPLCPEGEVPVIGAPNKRHFIKGNPMLGNYSQPGPAQTLPREMVNHLLLPFDQVYWKREGANSQGTGKPATGSGDVPCDGVSWFGSCFYYGTAAEQRVADGGGMTYTIESPVVDNSGDEGGHSIGEIAVMGTGTAGGSLDDVEMGFSVSPDQFGDNHPHLFVYHWINGAETCYSNSSDLCGWNQYSSTYSPYMDLSGLVGANVYIGWVHWNGAWWGWFNDQWLGYFKDSEWSGTFTKTATIHWYGEVASNNGIPPKTQMGNGKFPSDTTAALMETLCDVDAKAWVCWYRDLQTTGATKTSYYDILNHVSFGAVRYGGPGQ